MPRAVLPVDRQALRFVSGGRELRKTEFSRNPGRFTDGQHAYPAARAPQNAIFDAQTVQNDCIDSLLQYFQPESIRYGPRAMCPKTGVPVCNGKIPHPLARMRDLSGSESILMCAQVFRPFGTGAQPSLSARQPGERRRPIPVTAPCPETSVRTPVAQIPAGDTAPWRVRFRA